MGMLEWRLDFIKNVDKLKMLRDWVLIEKDERFDNLEMFGSIVVPGTSNLNIRETKIGKVLAVGSGNYNSRGEKWSTNTSVGSYVYYVRYGKHMFKDFEGTNYVICRESGVLAIVEIHNDRPIMLYPRLGRLWIEEIKEGDNFYKDSPIVKLPDSTRDRYRRWKILAIGPGVYSYEHLKVLPMSVKVDDIVYASIDSGDGFSWNFDGVRKEYRIVAENECVAFERPVV